MTNQRDSAVLERAMRDAIRQLEEMDAIPSPFPALVNVRRARLGCRPGRYKAIVGVDGIVHLEVIESAHLGAF